MQNHTLQSTFSGTEASLKVKTGKNFKFIHYEMIGALSLSLQIKLLYKTGTAELVTNLIVTIMVIRFF